MLEVGIAEAEHSLRRLMERARVGEAVSVKDETGASCRLVPEIPEEERKRARAAFERIRARAVALKMPFDWEEIKKDRDEGRP